MDKIEEAKKLFGSAVNNLSEQELKEELTKFDLLAECILDLAEKDIFKGKLLSELVSDLFFQNPNF